MTDEQFRSQAADRLIEQVVNGRMTRRQLLLRASVLGFSATAIGGLLAACGSPSSQSGATSTSASTSAPQYGGTYNYPLDGEPVGIAPNTYQESIGYNVVRQIFEGLMTYRSPPTAPRWTPCPTCALVYEGEPRREGVHVHASGKASTSSRPSTPKSRPPTSWPAGTPSPTRRAGSPAHPLTSSRPSSARTRRALPGMA